jgi:tRNA pseudouridine55 synthase
MYLPNSGIPIDGLVLVIDKPYGWTSFQAVNFIKHKVKNITGIKKFKIGHAGTLDPLATGVLVVCVGKKTKSIPEIQEGLKGYRGTILLGATTASYDLEKPVEYQNKNIELDLSTVQAATKGFIGEGLQTPPVFSAKRVGGKRAYKAARKGEEVKLTPNIVEIFRFDIEDKRGNSFDFDITCGKGTYIRSMAFDLGEILNCGGCLTALRRTTVGEHSIGKAVKLKDWNNWLPHLLVDNAEITL